MQAQRQTGSTPHGALGPLEGRGRAFSRATGPDRAGSPPRLVLMEATPQGPRRAGGDRSSSAPPAPGVPRTTPLHEVPRLPLAAAARPRQANPRPQPDQGVAEELTERAAQKWGRAALLACGLGLNAAGAYLAYTHLVPRGVSSHAGLCGLFLLDLDGGARIVCPGPSRAVSTWTHLLRGAGWTAAQLGQGASWLLAFPGFRVASLSTLLGGALLGASITPLTALVTRTCVRSPQARARLAEKASSWLVGGAQGPFGRGAWAVENLAKVATVGGALGLGSMVMVPATVALLARWSVHGLALGVRLGCAPAGPQIRHSPLYTSFFAAKASCWAAAATVQFASIDWALAASSLRGLVRP